MQTKAGTIEVTDYVEHEDGSATLVVDTDPDATRLLVSVGLRRLLEMAVNQEEGYEFKEDLLETTEGTRQEETGQGTEALPEGDDDDTRGSQ
jgi:hypothetical protein